MHILEVIRPDGADSGNYSAKLSWMLERRFLLCGMILYHCIYRDPVTIERRDELGKSEYLD
jgi:hypothetical protein